MSTHLSRHEVIPHLPYLFFVFFTDVVLFDTFSLSFRIRTGESHQNRRNWETNKGKWRYGLLGILENSRKKKGGEHCIKIP